MAAGDGVPADRMLAAGWVIAREAQRLAAVWSEEIPPAMTVRSRKNQATISNAAPPAYPNEKPRVNHPVFGPTLKRPDPPWVRNQHRPFLAPAADAKADKAAEEIAKTVDDMCREMGFEGTG